MTKNKGIIIIKKVMISISAAMGVLGLPMVFPAVGCVRGRFAFGAKKAWFVPYYLDVGTGESDFTWQGVAGLGYAFRWWEAVAAWRYLYYDLPSGEAINDMSFSGPEIGVTFRW